MVRSPRSTRPGRSDRDGDDGDDRREHEHEHEREDEPYDNPKEHLEIERRRFAEGLPPTPERYALAREQWYRLPGVVQRPSMDPVVGDLATDEAQPPGQAGPDEKGPGQ
jgi:hypothetical protein